MTIKYNFQSNFTQTFVFKSLYIKSQEKIPFYVAFMVLEYHYWCCHDCNKNWNFLWSRHIHKTNITYMVLFWCSPLIEYFSLFALPCLTFLPDKYFYWIYIWSTGYRLQFLLKTNFTEKSGLSNSKHFHFGTLSWLVYG